MEKYLILLITATCTVFQSYSQPVITNAEKYQGNVTYFYRDIPQNLNPVSSPGTNQTWDYTWLPDSNVIRQYKYSHPQNWPRLDDDIVLELPGAHEWYYYDVTSNATYRTGQIYYESEHGQTWKTFDTVGVAELVSPHNLTFGDVVTDTMLNINSSKQLRVFYLNADAYGTLMLPNDTFYNALRVFKVYLYIDTTTWDADTSLRFDYSWYSNDYPVPVLEVIMDTRTSPADTTYRGRYLLFDAPLFAKINAEKPAFQVHISDERIILKGDFEHMVEYKVTLFNMNGQRLFKTTTLLHGTNNILSLNIPLPSGYYFLNITDTKANTSTSIKTYKQ